MTPVEWKATYTEIIMKELDLSYEKSVQFAESAYDDQLRSCDGDQDKVPSPEDCVDAEIYYWSCE